MKIYLRNQASFEWELHEGTLKELQKEVDKRTIISSSTANIGYKANIKKLDIFTKEYIYIQLGLLPDEKGYYTMYKAVKKDLTDFYTGKYQYNIGKGDKSNEKRNQDKQCGNNSWHFSNLWNANSFGKEYKDFQLISAKIHISNILSVYDKVRVNKFNDVQLVDIEL